MQCPLVSAIVFFFNDTATTEIYTLSLHDALPIYAASQGRRNTSAKRRGERRGTGQRSTGRSEEHTSELQSQSNLVCRLLLEKKKSWCNCQSTCRFQAVSLRHNASYSIKSQLPFRH